jgi:hypothetical protein
MDDKEMIAAFFLRSEAVRQIAMGIFDKAEREVVLKFVAECEAMKLAKPLFAPPQAACL